MSIDPVAYAELVRKILDELPAAPPRPQQQTKPKRDPAVKPPMITERKEKKDEKAIQPVRKQ